MSGLRSESEVLFRPLELPSGVVLRGRLAKAAMSDSLGDGRGNPTQDQFRLYHRWARGGVALSIVGEVQGNPRFAEKPGNLVLNDATDHAMFERLAAYGADNKSQIWLQLGHAGALAHPPISTPKGPSALDLPGLRCDELSVEEIRALPSEFARTARLARQLGFGGVEIHAAHGFLLSQFMSPLFNRRTDAYGGSVERRMRLVLETVEEVRAAVGNAFPVGVKINATDQLDGGATEEDALALMMALDARAIDLFDVSGGTYFPGAKSASDSARAGAYFTEFTRRAKEFVRTPVMATGGFKTLDQAAEAVSSGATDLVGLARALVLVPDLPDKWRRGETPAPAFPRFTTRAEGRVTAWYTMHLTEIARDIEGGRDFDAEAAFNEYEERDARRVPLWNEAFGAPG